MCSVCLQHSRHISADEEKYTGYSPTCRLRTPPPPKDISIVHSHPPPPLSPPPRTPCSQTLKSLPNIRISHPINAMQIVCPPTTSPRDTPGPVWPFDDVENGTDIVDLWEEHGIVPADRMVHLRCVQSRGHWGPRTASAKPLLRLP